jgi:hypothetical protein
MTPPHLCFFVIISPLKRTWPFIWIILNFLHPRMICTKFDWHWPTCSGKDFKKCSVYLTLAITSPWAGMLPFIWTILNPTPPKDDLSQVWLKLAKWFWRRSRKCNSLTDIRTDVKCTTKKAHLSLQLRWAKNIQAYHESSRAIIQCYQT